LFQVGQHPVQQSASQINYIALAKCLEIDIDCTVAYSIDNRTILQFLTPSLLFLPSALVSLALLPACEFCIKEDNIINLSATTVLIFNTN
jgi:hypothetical protein